jgi:hypothetical protein
MTRPFLSQRGWPQVAYVAVCDVWDSPNRKQHKHPDARPTRSTTLDILSPQRGCVNPLKPERLHRHVARATCAFQEHK